MALAVQTSTLSKQFKSKEWKQRKREMHENNQKLRAQYESEKANASSAAKKAEIQTKIDQISRKKK